MTWIDHLSVRISFNVTGQHRDPFQTIFKFELFWSSSFISSQSSVIVDPSRHHRRHRSHVRQHPPISKKMTTNQMKPTMKTRTRKALAALVVVAIRIAISKSWSVVQKAKRTYRCNWTSMQTIWTRLSSMRAKKIKADLDWPSWKILLFIFTLLFEQKPYWTVKIYFCYILLLRKKLKFWLIYFSLLHLF